MTRSEWWFRETGEKNRWYRKNKTIEKRKQKAHTSHSIYRVIALRWASYKCNKKVNFIFLTKIIRTAARAAYIVLCNDNNLSMQQAKQLKKNAQWNHVQCFPNCFNKSHVGSFCLCVKYHSLVFFYEQKRHFASFQVSIQFRQVSLQKRISDRFSVFGKGVGCD